MSDPTADIDVRPIDHLRAIAEAATVGPWTAEPIGSEGYHVFGPEGSRAPMRGRARVAACTWQDWDEAAADAEFIAAFDPTTALALLDRLAAVEALADGIDEHDFTPECMEDRCRECLTAEAIRAAVTDRRYRPGQPTED